MSRVIVVTKTWKIAEGVGNKGPWMLRGVKASDPAGNEINESLKTFANLPVGEVEVDVERQDHPEHGTSFLLKPTGGRQNSGGGGGGDLAALTARVERLEAEVKRLSGLVDRRDPNLAGTPAGTPGIPDNDDIPF